ncbi:MAG TPA: hypothetical protein VIG88_12545 [Lysobacter sp.]
MKSVTSATSLHMSSRDDAPVLTVSQVREWVKQREMRQRLLAELPAQIEQDNRRIDAACVFLSEEQRRMVFNEAPEASDDEKPEAEALELTTHEAHRYKTHMSDGKPTWTGVIMKVFQAATTGLSHGDVMNRIRVSNTEFGDRLDADSKRYYTSMTKLEKRGELIRKNGLFFIPDLLTSLTAKGEIFEVPPKPVEGPKPYTSAWHILQCLRSVSTGLTAPEIKTMLSNEEGVTPALLQTNNFIFNVLKSMQDKGWIVRDDDSKRYIAVPEKGEAPRERGFVSHASELAR